MKVLPLNAGYSICVHLLFVLGVRIKIIGLTTENFWQKDVPAKCCISEEVLLLSY